VGASTEMVSDCRPYANCKVLVQRVDEHLLPTAQSWLLGWPGRPVSAPDAGNRHTDLPGNLNPSQTLIAKLYDVIGGGGVWRRT